MASKHFDKNSSARGVGFAGDPRSIEQSGSQLAALKNCVGKRRGAREAASAFLADRLERLRAFAARAWRRLARAVASFAEGRGYAATALAPGAKIGPGRPLTLKSIFGDDYWPDRRRPANWRLALGLFLAPLATLLPTLLLASLLYRISESDGAAAWSMTQEAGVEFFSALYGPLLLGSALGGAMLWALRLRSRRAFALAGAILGAVAGGIVYLSHGALPPVAAIYALLAGALSMLALRAIAEVRKLR